MDTYDTLTAGINGYVKRSKILKFVSEKNTRKIVNGKIPDYEAEKKAEKEINEYHERFLKYIATQKEYFDKTKFVIIHNYKLGINQNGPFISPL